VNEARAHASLALAEELEPQLRGIDREAAFARFAASDAELLSAVEHFIQAGSADAAIRLARRVAPFLQATGRLDDAIDLLDRALAVPGDEAEERGRAYADLGLLYFWRADDGRATASFERGIEIGRTLESPTVTSLGLTGLARIALRNDDLSESRRLCHDALARADGRPDPLARGSVAHVLGVTEQMAGELEAARRWMNERIELARETGSLGALGIEANNLAMVERQLGNFDRAEELSREALDIFYRRRDAWAMPFGLVGLAAVAVHRGDLERAATLLGAAEAMVEAQGAAWPPDERPHYESAVAAIEASPHAEEIEEARTRGRALSSEAAVAYALGGAA
jgi:tetratricopeptide (TPR) repeat protein